eukprot:28557-Pelagococcus_subviridis.AAC.1
MGINRFLEVAFLSLPGRIFPRPLHIYNFTFKIPVRRMRRSPVRDERTAFRGVAMLRQVVAM